VPELSKDENDAGGGAGGYFRELEGSIHGEGCTRRPVADLSHQQGLLSPAGALSARSTMGNNSHSYALC